MLKHLIFCFSLYFAITSFSAIADTIQIKTPLIDNCDKKSHQAIVYSICLDEAVKQVERELKAWQLESEDKVKAITQKLQNEAALYEFKKANKYYNQFIESHCRSLFFTKQNMAEAANLFRVCKIKQTRIRMQNLKYEINQK